MLMNRRGYQISAIRDQGAKRRGTVTPRPGRGRRQSQRSEHREEKTKSEEKRDSSHRRRGMKKSLWPSVVRAHPSRRRRAKDGAPFEAQGKPSSSGLRSVTRETQDPGTHSVPGAPTALLNAQNSLLTPGS